MKTKKQETKKPRGRQAGTTYSVSVQCSNCKWTGTRTLTKGTLVNDSSCPHCGCNCLEVVNARPADLE